MPKPLLLNRRSGLYVRFRVPTDLRDAVGSRFLVRPLRHPPGETARLAAAVLDVALSNAFRKIRTGGVMVDIKQLLKDAEDAFQLTIGGVRLPNGVELTNVLINTAEDERQFCDLMAAATPTSTSRGAKKAVAVERRKENFLGALSATHLADLERAGRDKKTVLESRHSLMLLRGIVGDIPAADLTSDHCRQFFDDVAYWPRHATKRPEFANLSVREVLAKAKTMAEPPPAAATLNKHHQRLSTFFNWLKKNKHLTENPLHGLVRQDKDDAEEETGRAFTQEELDAIFEPTAYVAWAAKYPHRFWVPILALYSGARVTELSQLYVADVEVINGIPGYHINRRFPGQKLKNKASRRFVPLAQPVLDAGFLRFAEEAKAAGQARLFPQLPNNDGGGFGKQMSKQFSAYLRKRGVTESGLGMHAFRHTLATRLARAKVPLQTIGKITGHKGEQGTLGKFYIDEPTLHERLDALALFEPGINLPWVTVLERL
ncbi:site-specific integrase [Luteibacter sp. ME-Dv--P-043b]|uniref:site-specific integrase n=1 Tax=Luteibacter sp. ME-Dv--P-043b TaxID=3040291 RepID=UPI00255467FB|nr:site-specific integrase [Luteibacter sp. ME-Dv--P-043b]